MGKMIKVLHVGLSANPGGIENIVKSWDDLLPDNIKFDFINNADEPLAFQKQFEGNGATIYRIISRKEDYFRSCQEIKNIIRDGKYDYVQHHMMSFSWPQPLLYAQRTYGTQPIAHSHTAGSKDLSLKYRVLDGYGRWAVGRRPYLRVACGAHSGEDMFHTRQVTVIKNGVDFNKCAFSQEARIAIRKQYNISNDAFVVGHVGRSGNVKNYPFIIHMFCNLIKERPDSILMLIGNVQDDECVRTLVRENRIEDKVIFTGLLLNLGKYYSAMDVFVLPSLHEGVSVAMIEAQAAGLSCVVSNFVSKDADISGRVRYVPIDDTRDCVNALLSVPEIDRTINNLRVDWSYDLRNTAEEMFSFYERNLCRE